MNTIKLKEDKNIEIWHDDNASNPREWDNLSTFMFHHGRMSLSDVAFTYAGDTGTLLGDFKITLSESGLKLNDVVYVPVSMYEHGSVSLFVGERSDWDTGHLGYAYASKEKLRKEYNVKNITKKISDAFENEVARELEEFSQYINGGIYGFSIVDANTNEVIDSCGGFYGDDILDNGMLEYMDSDTRSLVKSLDSIATI